jgi:uncharacterized OsmC-like protein
VAIASRHFPLIGLINNPQSLSLWLAFRNRSMGRSLQGEVLMDLEQLRARQAPLKERYRDDPSAAIVVLHANGVLDPDGVVCRVETHLGSADAGLHPAAGGDAGSACSGDMLLQALVACAGVTLAAVAKAMGIVIGSGRIEAEGDLDFRGTLGVSKEAPVGFRDIRLRFLIDSDASDDQRANLLRLTERYCVIYQTLKNPPTIAATIEAAQSP